MDAHCNVAGYNTISEKEYRELTQFIRQHRTLLRLPALFATLTECGETNDFINLELSGIFRVGVIITTQPKIDRIILGDFYDPLPHLLEEKSLARLSRGGLTAPRTVMLRIRREVMPVR